MAIAICRVLGVFSLALLILTPIVRAEETEDNSVPIPAALNFEMNDIDGKPIHLGRYHGQVVLLVNVASKCGLTPQYKTLQRLHETYADQGLAIVGIPANNFGNQEPGSNDEIKTFCTTRYDVAFDMLAKVSVKGEDQAPLYKFLTGKQTNGDLAGPIKWNFTKFLINREGEPLARYEPRTQPDDKQVIEAIEKALAQPAPDELCEPARQADE